MLKMCLRCGQEGHTSSSCKRPVPNWLTRLLGTAAGGAL